MTLTWTGELVGDKAQLPRWQPLVSSRAPGYAVAMTMTDRLRLVVLDLADPHSLGAWALRTVNSPVTDLNATDLAERLVVASRGRSHCSGVAVADLFPDGTLDLQIRNAPPAVLLRPSTPARLLPGGRRGDWSARVAPGEVLLLYSASFLEDPPPVLATVRHPRADDAALAKLRRGLSAAPHGGAIGSVVSPSR